MDIAAHDEKKIGNTNKISHPKKSHVTKHLITCSPTLAQKTRPQQLAYSEHSLVRRKNNSCHQIEQLSNCDVTQGRQYVTTANTAHLVFYGANGKWAETPRSDLPKMRGMAREHLRMALGYPEQAKRG